MADTDWITEGAQVAEFSSSNWHSENRVTLTTIDRLTATQIVLANGRRYHRDRLSPVGEYPTRTELLPADDQVVLNALAVASFKLVQADVHGVIRRGLRTAGEVLAALDEIEQAITTARVAIAARLSD